MATALGAVLGLLPPSLPGQQAEGAIMGRVMARNDTVALTPADRAAIGIVGSARGTTTGPDGRFLVDRVPPGPHTLRVRLLGYRPVERAVLRSEEHTSELQSLAY